MKEVNKMIKLGQIVRDKLTGFKGIVMAETRYLTGCKSYGLLPLTLKKDEGTPHNWVWMDSGRLEETKEEIGTGGGPDNPSAPQSD
jgi:heat shock protein HspQ